MAMPRRIKVEFGEVFPYGVFAVSDVSPQRDFRRSTDKQDVQEVDEDSGLPVWTGDFLDADPSARKADRQFSVRIVSKVTPLLPEAVADLPFRPVEFEGLTATPNVSENGGGRARLAWSFRATGMRAPGKPTGKASPTSGGA